MADESRLIGELRGFQLWLLKRNGLVSVGARALMFEFLFMFDESLWPAEIEISGENLAQRLGISRNSFNRYRDELAEFGLVKVTSKGRQVCGYQIVSFLSVCEEAESCRPKKEPGLEAIVFVAEYCGVRVNDYAERQLGRLAKTFGCKRAMIGLLNHFLEGGVNFNEFIKRAYQEIGFGNSLRRDAQRAGADKGSSRFGKVEIREGQRHEGSFELD